MAHVLRNIFGMSYRKILHTANLANTDRSLVLRQKFAQKMLTVLAEQRRIINIDESSIPFLDFRRHKWAPRSEKNSMPRKDLTPKVNMIAAIDTAGRVYAALTQINTDSEVMISFLSRLATVLT